MYTIYVHIFPNGKTYVGCTKEKLSKRFGKKGNQYRAKAIKMAIEDFGWDNIEHKILEENLNYEEAVKKEKYYIMKFKSDDVNFGYNKKIGGDFLSNTKSYIHKITKNRQNWYDLMKGKSLPQETKNKILSSHTNRLTKYILQCDKDNNIIKKWSSLCQIQRELSFDKSLIRRCCCFNESCKKYRTAYNYIWKYEKKS